MIHDVGRLHRYIVRRYVEQIMRGLVDLHEVTLQTKLRPREY